MSARKGKKMAVSSRKFKACLFDMDGLLIDSETVYTISFSDILINNFNRKEGLTWDVKIQLQGLPGVKACQVVIDCYALHEETTAEELYKLTSKRQEELWPTVGILPGVQELVEYLKSKEIPICVCTSSHKDKYLLKTSRHDALFKLFNNNIITGDNPTIANKGKPLPFIWWLGLEILNQNHGQNIKPEECLVFEDAMPGFLSGKRSGGYVIWVPDQRALDVIQKDEITKLIGESNEHGVILKSLEDFEPSDYGL
jgi:pseudouridine-5'-monophosphatase